MSIRDTSKRGWLWAALSALIVIGTSPAPAHADDFDDDFAAEPTSPPEEGAATDAGDAFDDDFAEPAPSEAPSAGAEGEASAGFDDDFAATNEAEVSIEAPDEARMAVDDDVVDPFEDGYASKRGSLRARRLRTHSSYYGPTGGIRVVDAGGGAQKSFRMALTTELFTKDGFIVEGDDHSRVGGSLSFAITPWEYLEIAGSIVAYASANDAEDPNLFQVLGDTRVFVRGFGQVKPWLLLGGDLELALLNGVGEVGLSAKGTSIGLRANASADLRAIKRSLPLVFRTNLRYYFDNSSKLIASTEQARYDNLLNPAPRADEHRNLLSPVERYAFTINRVDSLSLSFGVEAPLRVKDDYYLHPILEWGFALPINRQDYDCVFRPSDPDDLDGCLAEEGFSSRHSTLTLGARFLPPVRGLSFMTAFDIGTTGTRDFVRELAPNSRWMWLNGLSYTYDLKPPKPKVITREVPVQAPAPKRGRIRGRILEAESEEPVAQAVVRFEDPSLSPLLSAEDGSFVSYTFEPGPQTMTLESDAHEPGTCEATLPQQGGDAEVTCHLVALPQVGAAAITLRDEQGETLDGLTLNVQGETLTRTGITDIQGTLSLNNLPPGSYQASVEAEGYLARRTPFEVRVNETTQLDIALLKTPKKSLVGLSKKRIRIKRQVQFKRGSSEIKIQSHALLAQVADVMLRHPEILRVEIQGHTDNTGGFELNQRLSQERADSVRSWLVEAGVEPERMTAKGYGPTKPLVPNITPANRARNRRVQFEIVERAEGP